jgi:hypothetical protein
VNAFQTSSPIKSPEVRPSVVQDAVPDHRKTKYKANDKAPMTRSFGGSSPQSSPTASQYEAMDTRMGEGADGDIFDEDTESGEEFDEAYPINWATEVYCLIFFSVSGHLELALASPYHLHSCHTVRCSLYHAKFDVSHVTPHGISDRKGPILQCFDRTLDSPEHRYNV